MRAIVPLLLIMSILAFTSVCRAQETSSSLVTAATEKEGDLDRIAITNNAPCRVTVTLSFTARENALVNVTLPYTAVIGKGETMRVVTVSPADPAKSFTYHYEYKWQPGSFKTVTSQKLSYLLPYKPGSSYVVAQAYNADFTHRGDTRYSIDWEMPTGTEICAAREGTVILVRDSFDGGGTKDYYLKRANLILIIHPDGTIAQYAHIKKDGSKVRTDQHVSAGEVIALSGNVGYSQGPHLHFCVFIPVDGTRIKTIPVTFKTRISDNSTMMTGDRYEAP